MGSSTSVNTRKSFPNHIYISFNSFNDDNENIKILISELQKLNYNIINSEIINPLDEYSNIANINFIEEIIEKSLHIIICISKNTMRSMNQNIEINKALISNKNLIYMMLDKEFTPLNEAGLNIFIQTNKWFPFYDIDTVTSSIKDINKILEVKI